MKKEISNKQWLIIALVIFVAAVMCLTGYKIYTSDYVSVNAEVTNISVRTTGKKHRQVDYEELQYVYNKKDYTLQRDIGFLNREKIGDKVEIKIDPENPTAIEDQSLLRMLCIVSSVFFLISAFLAIKSFKSRGKD